ncbi:uncharacterized protein LOC135689351 [Rhopilema esculentum]|uniref:uncharacterized protein LOC135689351 n=1 Tax=Rhopilema esculentum TaxID=499914 RepID=UPI0031DFBAA2
MAQGQGKLFSIGHIFRPERDKDTIFISDATRFQQDVRRNSNGLINANGGVIYFGITTSGRVEGVYVSRTREDEYRLTVDCTIGSFQPFYAPFNYRIIFHPINKTDYKVIELKISAGAPGQIYEDGQQKLYLFSDNEVLGPLWPLEIQHLVKKRFQESLKSFTGLESYTTPALAKRQKQCT